ncbi:MAG: methyltransferase domain-containing protein [Steroidobacteraceae bacterium]
MTPTDSPSAARAGQVAGRLAAIAGLLACPACRGNLTIGAGNLHCTRCDGRFAIQDGDALLAIRGTSETWGKPQPAEQSANYQTEYQRVEKVATYNLHYRQRLFKRFSTRREYKLIGRQIRRIGRSHILLDPPCGGGCLTPAFSDSADLVIEADNAIGQILFGCAESKVATPRVWMTASAFHIPLGNNAVDGAICVRLAHHLPTAAERERLLQELLRVSRRFVIFTYFDHYSLKYLTHRLRHPFGSRPPKLTMTTARVAELVRAQGARLVAAPPLSRISSGHRYALIVKEGVRP